MGKKTWGTVSVRSGTSNGVCSLAILVPCWAFFSLLLPEWSILTSHPLSLFGPLTKPCLPITLVSANCLMSSFTEEMEMSRQVLLFPSFPAATFMDALSLPSDRTSDLPSAIQGHFHRLPVCPISQLMHTSSSCRHPSSPYFYSPIGTQTGHQDFPS